MSEELFAIFEGVRCLSKVMNEIQIFFSDNEIDWHEVTFSQPVYIDGDKLHYSSYVRDSRGLIYADKNGYVKTKKHITVLQHSWEKVFSDDSILTTR